MDAVVELECYCNGEKTKGAAVIRVDRCYEGMRVADVRKIEPVGCYCVLGGVRVVEQSVVRTVVPFECMKKDAA